MEYKLNPCQYKPCEDPDIVEMDKILVDIARRPYEPFTSIAANQTYTPYHSITKFKTLELNPNSTIAFDLNNSNKYYVVVIKKLIFSNVDPLQPELNVVWFDGSLNELFKSLIGRDGSPAPKQTRRASDGFPGGKGERGKTRHSPTIFFFVDKVVFQNPNPNDVAFNFSLRGVRGGKGGNGGTGGNGTKGNTGGNGRQGDILRGCRSGSDGGQGGRPGMGGQGGDGGCGGNGPSLNIFYGDEELRSIFERSKYNVEGAEAGHDNDYYFWGDPGRAGKPGEGGDGGRRAGKCDGGDKGPSGKPGIKDPGWKSYNYGHGLPTTHGRSGNYIYDPIDDVAIRVVFSDPDNPQDETIK